MPPNPRASADSKVGDIQSRFLRALVEQLSDSPAEDWHETLLLHAPGSPSAAPEAVPRPIAFTPAPLFPSKEAEEERRKKEELERRKAFALQRGPPTPKKADSLRLPETSRPPGTL